MKLINLLTFSSACIIASQAHKNPPPPRPKSVVTCEQASDCTDATITLEPFQLLECLGSESCKGKTITSTDVNGNEPNIIKCYGENSCNGVELLVTKKSVLFCLGAQSCRKMRINSDIRKVNAWGSESFSDAKIGVDVQVIEFSGLGEDGFEGVNTKLARSSTFLAYESALVADLHSKGEDVELEIAGYHAISGMEVYCEQGSTCFVNCVDCRFDNSRSPTNDIFIVTEDSNLKLNCPFKGHSCEFVEVIVPSLNQVEVTGDGASDVTITVASQTRRLQRNNKLTSVQKERESSKTRNRNLNSKIICKDFKECESQIFDTFIKDLECDGAMSCFKSSAMDSSNDDIFLTGYKSGQQGTFLANRIQVEGMFGLLNAEATTKNLDIEGYGAGIGATIRAHEDYIHIDAMAVDGLIDATIICEAGKSCELECKTFRACTGAILDCRATDQDCTQTCDEAYHGCATEVPDCTKITTGVADCQSNKFCFWVNNSCKNKEEESCAALSVQDCSKSKGVCLVQDDQCVFDKKHRPRHPHPKPPMHIPHH